MVIESDVQKLAPGAIVDLFELDATALGGSVLRWHNGVNSLGNDIVWQGNTYARLPVEAGGFARSGQGTMPRPTMKVGNTTGLVGALARELRDLCGTKVTRRRTFVKYLDAVNFPGGVNPQADPNVGFPNEVWFVDRKAAENGIYVEFELSAAFDVQGVKLPRRQCIQNVCQSAYRGPECGYAGVAMYTKDDLLTTNPALDQCAKRLSSCKKRFGEFGTLNTSAFPGVGLIR
jgi:lambda family phage minor tail protein L